MSTDPKTVKLHKRIVARGRSIDVPDPTRRKQVGLTPEGVPVTTSICRSFGPGEEVELPYDEIQNLTALGFLVDPDAPQVIATAGDHWAPQSWVGTSER